MISAQEIGRGIFGAWRLARGDRDGIQFFDNTPEAALASFKAALLAAPIHILLTFLHTDWSLVAVGAFAAFLINAISFVTDWTAFPLAMYYVARFCDRDDLYWRYLAAYNWASVLQISLFFLVSLSIASGLLAPWLGAVLGYVTLLAILVYKGFIAHVGLETSMRATIGIVLLDLGISAVLSAVMANLLLGQGLLGG